MLDKVVAKLIQDQILPLQELSQKRIDELMYIKSKIFTNPEEVEIWINQEITKLNNIDISSSLHRIIGNKQ